MGLAREIALGVIGGGALLVAKFGAPDLSALVPADEAEGYMSAGNPWREGYEPEPALAPVYYQNCAAARAAGAAPILRGEAGYRLPLDRDGDGVACEPWR